MNLDSYEQELLDSVENGEWQSKPDLPQRLKTLQSHIKNEKKRPRKKGTGNFLIKTT